MKNLTEEEILDSVIKGNHGDFALLIDMYKDRAFTLLKKMLKNEMDAEEALQDSFMKVFNSLSNFKGDSKFSTWFYKIVYNTALTIISSKKRKIVMEMSSVDDHFDLGEVLRLEYFAFRKMLKVEYKLHILMKDLALMESR